MKKCGFLLESPFMLIYLIVDVDTSIDENGETPKTFRGVWINGHNK